MIDDLLRDVRYAGRIGIGANTAMFSIVGRLMFRPLPVRDPSQLVTLRSAQSFSLDYATFDTLRERAPDVADLSAVIRTDRYNVGIGANQIDEGPVRLALVSGTYSHAGDVVTITGAVSVIVALSAVAGLLPALRAARVNPMMALRCD